MIGMEAVLITLISLIKGWVANICCRLYNAPISLRSSGIYSKKVST